MHKIAENTVLPPHIGQVQLLLLTTVSPLASSFDCVIMFEQFLGNGSQSGHKQSAGDLHIPTSSSSTYTILYKSGIAIIGLIPGQQDSHSLAYKIVYR